MVVAAIELQCGMKSLDVLLTLSAAGFADSFSSTLDFGNLWKTIVYTAWHMGRQAMRLKF